LKNKNCSNKIIPKKHRVEKKEVRLPGFFFCAQNPTNRSGQANLIEKNIKKVKITPKGMLNGTPPFAKLIPEDEKLYHNMRSGFPIRSICHTHKPRSAESCGGQSGRGCERDVRT
jgi:hypothetical protein